jgi:hypothetical protein
MNQQIDMQSNPTSLKLRGTRKPFFRKYCPASPSLPAGKEGLRWVKWVIAVLFLIIIGVVVAGFTINGQNEKRAQDEEQKAKISQIQEEDQVAKDIREGRKPPMTADEVAKAETALFTGISIDDPQNDYLKTKPGTIQPDGRPDNSNPWPIQFTDVKKAQIGADETNLYVKYTFYGTFPNEMYRNGEDYLAMVLVNLGLHGYYNHNLNKSDAEALFQVGLAYASKSGEEVANGEYGSFFNPPKLGTSTFGEANSEVKDKNNEDTYGIGTDKGKTFGGAGYDYIIAAFPLSNLGLLFGDTITFDAVCETGSKVYHHQSGDVLLDYGSAKSGKYITWKIGSNTYTTIIPKH